MAAEPPWWRGFFIRKSSGSTSRNTSAKMAESIHEGEHGRLLLHHAPDRAIRLPDAAITGSGATGHMAGLDAAHHLQWPAG